MGKQIITEGVDLVLIHNEKSMLELIEVKDYRRNQRTKKIELSVEVADKVSSTLAGLFAASCNANDYDEQEFAKKCMQKNNLRDSV